MGYDSGHGDGWGHCGMDHGHGGASFADLFAGVELAAGLTGHSLSLADAATAAIAIEVAQSHGGPAALHGHGTGYLHEVPALAAAGWHAPDPSYTDTEPLGRRLTLPGIARGATTAEVLYWPHGACGSGLRGVQELVRQLVQQAGMMPFKAWEHNVAGLADFNQTEKRILAVGWSGASETRQGLPSGWYRGARGATHLWRECFRRRLLPSWIPLFGEPDNFDSRRTFLVVSGSSWYYEQTADYETRVAFFVYSLPFVQDGHWTYRFDQIKRYRDRAEHLAKALKEYLHAHPTPAASIERRQMGPGATQPDAPPAG